MPAVPFPLPQLRGAIAATALPLSLPNAVERVNADAAFDELYRKAFPKVYAFMRSQVSSVETAQDLVGRTFLKIYTHRLKTPVESVGAMQWTFRIAHTTLIDYWRVEKRRESASLRLDEIPDLPAVSDNPEAAYQRKERSAHLVRLINHLSDDDRTMVAMKFVAHQTNREIAVTLRLSEGAVSMRLIRALRRLREKLQETGWS